MCILTALLVICSACQAAVSPATTTLSPFPTNTPPPESTPTRTSTATIRPTETEAPYLYEVTAEKLNHRPIDMEYLKTHLSEYVQAPSPWEQGVETFNQWVDEDLDPAMGSVDKRVPNVVIKFFGSGADSAMYPGVTPRQVPLGEIPFFYFLHNGTPYPVYILNGQKKVRRVLIFQWGWY
jgi:hypothetical protein